MEQNTEIIVKKTTAHIYTWSVNDFFTKIINDFSTRWCNVTSSMWLWLSISVKFSFENLIRRERLLTKEAASWRWYKFNIIFTFVYNCNLTKKHTKTKGQYPKICLLLFSYAILINLLWLAISSIMKRQRLNYKIIKISKTLKIHYFMRYQCNTHLKFNRFHICESFWFWFWFLLKHDFIGRVLLV